MPRARPSAPVMALAPAPADPPPDPRSLRDMARDHSTRAVLALAEVLASETAPAAARVSAATALLDRGWGRPQQALEVCAPDGAGIPPRIEIMWVKGQDDSDGDDQPA